MSISNSMAERSSNSIMQRSFSALPTNDVLPVFQQTSKRSRSLSSITLTLGRSKSFSAVRDSYGGRSVKKIWNWGLGWMFTRESSKRSKAVLGGPIRNKWSDMVQKAKLQFRKLLIPDYNVGRPQTCRYSSFDYSKNFDDGCGKF